MNRILKICLIGVGIATVAVVVFKVPINSVLFFGFILACPLMHLFMGHGMHEDKKEGEKTHPHH